MKYKSLRFFIQINALLGWAVIVVGTLVSLFMAVSAGLLSENVSQAFGAFVWFVIGVLISAVVGMSIFAMGDLYQCFLDIEENTGLTVSVVKGLALNRGGVSTSRETPREESSPSTFTYMCPNCHMFQRSDVVTCQNCGAENPHHPANKPKAEGSQIASAGISTGDGVRCVRCGYSMSQGDKFCSSCGYLRV